MTRVVLASFDRLPAPKGASAHILANAAILAERYDVSLVTLGTEPVAGLRHRPLFIPEPNWLLRGQEFHRQVAAVFERYPFDVYHVRSPWEGLAVPPGARIVYEVNALYSVEVVYAHPGVLALPAIRRKLRAMELGLLDRCALVLTPSAVTARYLTDLGIGEDKIRVVPNAPSIPFAPVERPRRDVVRLCYVGSLAPWQGLEELLGVLPRLTAPFRLDVVTGDSERRVRRLRRRIERLGLDGRTTFVEPGPATALAAILAEQDIGLAPLAPCERNLVQGCMPVKILDFAAAGLPVLAPDMPVVREILGPSYPLYRRWSREGLLRRLGELAGSHTLRLDLGAEAQEAVRLRCAPETQRARLLEAYDRVLA